MSKGEETSANWLCMTAFTNLSAKNTIISIQKLIFPQDSITLFGQNVFRQYNIL
jgi:hypothetical protein